MNFNNIVESPKTVDEAVEKLLTIHTDDEKEQIKASPEEDLVLLHFSLGRDIRNTFRLNNGNTVLLRNRSADDVSMEIIEALWKTMHQC